MKHEYHEGPEAAKNFEKVARIVFQAKKAEKPTKRAKLTAKSQKIGKKAENLPQ